MGKRQSCTCVFLSFQTRPRRLSDLLDHHDDILRCGGGRLDMVHSYYADVIK